MPLEKAVNHVFDQLKDSIDRLSRQQYGTACINLSGNSIGQHVRHIIELFRCLNRGYLCGSIDYEKRARDIEIETDKELALTLLIEIEQGIMRTNKELSLVINYDGLVNESTVILTNYDREIAYNLEHTIHHMALIRIGIKEVSDLILSEEYGVASATIKYRKQCAQ
jgi:hypothetical protein